MWCGVDRRVFDAPFSSHACAPSVVPAKTLRGYLVGIQNREAGARTFGCTREWRKMQDGSARNCRTRKWGQAAGAAARWCPGLTAFCKYSVFQTHCIDQAAAAISTSTRPPLLSSLVSPFPRSAPFRTPTLSFFNVKITAAALHAHASFICQPCLAGLLALLLFRTSTSANLQLMATASGQDTQLPAHSHRLERRP